jgi:hypothetical protein
LKTLSGVWTFPICGPRWPKSIARVYLGLAKINVEP